MQDIINEKHNSLDYFTGQVSPIRLYSTGISYITSVLYGFTQLSIFLFGNYGQNRPLSTPHVRQNRLSEPVNKPIRQTINKQPDNITYSNILTEMIDAGKGFIESYIMKNPDSVLQSLLELMSLAYSSNYELRRHIKNMHANYQFRFGNHDAPFALEISKGRMHVSPICNKIPDVNLKFRDPLAFKNIIFTSSPDFLNAVLKQDVVVDGNITYLYKLAYLVKHLQIKLFCIDNNHGADSTNF